MYITCGNCGEKSPFDQWLELPTGEQLPDDHYRCPRCCVEIRRAQGPPKMINFGFGGAQEMIVPGDITIEQTTSRVGRI